MRIRPIGEDLSSAALAQAGENNVASFFDWIRRAPGVEWDDRPGRFRVGTGIAHPFFNGVYRTLLPASEADEYVDETLAYFTSKRIPWWWWTWPSAEPADLRDRLTARGMALLASFPVMSVDLRAIREDWSWPEGLTIARVANADMLEKWTQPAAVALGLAEGVSRFIAVFSALGFEEDAPVQSYIGYVEGIPVATSQMFLGAGVAGIYSVGTIPEYRGRGIGKALTIAPLRDARTMGYRWGILESSKMGLPVYLRIGFREDCQLQVHGPPPPA